MGNLEKAGIGVVIALLGIILIVAFIKDPDESESSNPSESRTSESLQANAGRGSMPEGGSTTSSPSVPSGLQQPRAGSGSPGPDSTIRNIAGVREIPSSSNLDSDSDTSPRQVLPSGSEEMARSVRRDLGGPSKAEGPTRSNGEEVAGKGRASDSSPSTNQGANLQATPGYPKSVRLLSGDSLWKVAAREYGADLADEMVRKIQEENGIRDAQRVTAGTMIRLPAPSASNRDAQSSSTRRTPDVSTNAAGGSRAAAVRADAEKYLPFEPGPLSFMKGNGDIQGAAEGGRQQYVVKPNESLSEIAIRELGSARFVKEIVALNGLSSPDRISAGMKLKLPVVRR